MNAAEAIQDVLTRSGLSKAELSRLSGVSRALLDDYLKGRSQPAVAQLARLGEAAGLRLDLAWQPMPADDSSPSWAHPSDSMAAPPLTIEERAVVLARVVPVAMAMRRRPKAELTFPPFRTLRAKASR